MNNHYSTLGVSDKASRDDIKKAYRKLSLKFHPDKNNDGNAAKFQEISEAYEYLEDPVKRRQYDMARSSPFGGLGGGGGIGQPDDILKMFFGGAVPFGGANVRVFHGGQGFPMGGMGGFSMGETVETKPSPIIKTISITIEQAYAGANIPLEIERTIQTSSEKRTEVERVYIDIPMGIDDNEIITISDKGNVIGNNKGDIKINIRIKNNSKFIRRGLDLFYTKKVSLKEALVGFSFEIKHLSGKTYRINNKDGKVITETYKLVVNYMGMKRERRHPASPVVGHLIIKFEINFPESLTKEQIEAIEKFF